jgi:transketolase
VAQDCAPAAPQVIVLATGSELAPSLEAAKRLGDAGVLVRVVSMPCLELFEEQDEEYRGSVLTDGVPILAVEAGSPLGWWRIVGTDGDVLGVHRYGASAPGPQLMEKFGFTPENIAERARRLVYGAPTIPPVAAPEA